MSWRYHVQRALTNQWLDRDAQLTDVNVTWALSGPGELTATVRAPFANAIAVDDRTMYEEWSTLVYAEKDDVIRWGGILTDIADAGNGAANLTFTSFSGYPNGRIWLGMGTTYEKYYSADAFDLIRMLWTYVQSQVNSGLGVTVSPDLSGYKVGGVDPGPKPVRQPGQTDQEYETVLINWQSQPNEPYYLAWWNTPDCGNEIDNLLGEAGGEYVETHSWGADKDTVSHLITLYAFSAGRRRNDLRFVEGENVLPAPLPDHDGADFANYVRAIGFGEDRSTLNQEAQIIDGRLRRDLIVSSKSTTRNESLKQIAQLALNISQDTEKIDSISVFDHPNARIGSWQLGDEIHLQAFSGYKPVDRWLKITGWSLKPDESDVATLNVTKLT